MKVHNATCDIFLPKKTNLFIIKSLDLPIYKKDYQCESMLNDTMGMQSAKSKMWQTE